MCIRWSRGSSGVPARLASDRSAFAHASDCSKRSECGPSSWRAVARSRGWSVSALNAGARSDGKVIPWFSGPGWSVSSSALTSRTSESGKIPSMAA